MVTLIQYYKLQKLFIWEKKRKKLNEDTQELLVMLVLCLILSS